MRIVSLLPSATEIVFALGLGDELVGRTRECDFPPEAAAVPIVEIGSKLGAEALTALRPDLILAPDGGAARPIGNGATVVGLQPVSIEGILNSISTIGAMTAAEDESVGLLEMLRERLAAIENRVLERRLAGFAPRRVVCLEWLSPPFAAGHWVPEQVRRAGGWELLGDEGDASAEISWRQVRAVDPDQLLLMPCGLDAARTAAEWEPADVPDSLADLRAVREGEVYALDGAAYFSRPGPRVIDGVALLAGLFDPEGFPDELPAEAWRPVSLVS